MSKMDMFKPRYRTFKLSLRDTMAIGDTVKANTNKIRIFVLSQ